MTWSWRLEEGECTGCGICADVCPDRAILMTREMPLPEPVAGRCTGCRTCVNECPSECIVVEQAGIGRVPASGAE